jgi:hypothetical protein
MCFPRLARPWRVPVVAGIGMTRTGNFSCSPLTGIPPTCCSRLMTFFLLPSTEWTISAHEQPRFSRALSRYIVETNKRLESGSRLRLSAAIKKADVSILSESSSLTHSLVTLRGIGPGPRTGQGLVSSVKSQKCMFFCQKYPFRSNMEYSHAVCLGADENKDKNCALSSNFLKCA